VPIENSQYPLLIYEKDLFSNTVTNQDSFDVLQQQLYSSLNTNLHAVLVKKFAIVFDLDETLIRTRIPKQNEQDLAQNGEFEFFVQGYRYCCCVRPGTDLLLKWASQLFQVYIFTNSIFEYAKEVCKILDPAKETILSNIENDDQLKAILKSRELMTPVDYIPKPLGLKDLAKFSIGTFETVILDDDVKVWKDRENVLPFDQITQFKSPNDFFYRVRLESWKLLGSLAKKRVKLLQQENKEPQGKSCEVVLEAVQILNKQLVVSYSQQHVMETATGQTAKQLAAACLDDDSEDSEEL